MRTLLTIALFLGLSGPARAHPFSSELYGQQLDLRLSSELVVLDYLVEVPAREAVGWLAQARRERPEVALDLLEAEVIEGQLDELQGGLRLRIDEEPVAWTRGEPAVDSGVGDKRFVRFQLRLEAPLSPGPHTLAISNGNHPDQSTLFQVQLEVDDSVVVDAATFYEVDGEGELQVDHSGRWEAREEARELGLALRSRGSLGTMLHRELRVLGRPVFSGPPPATMPGSAALSTAGWPARIGLGGVRPEVVIAGAAMVLAVLLGLARGRLGGGNERWLALGVSALCFAVWPGPLWGFLGNASLGLMLAACLPLGVDLLVRGAKGQGGLGTVLGVVGMGACLAAGAAGWTTLGGFAAVVLWLASMLPLAGPEAEGPHKTLLPSLGAGLVIALGVAGAMVGLALQAGAR